MTLSKKPYKGTRDFFPQDKRIQNYLFGAMGKTAQVFGYEPYDGPLIEEVDLYKAKSGEELVTEQIYSFYDRGERFVAIRPEMTPTLARMIAQIHREQPRPIRWYSLPNLMRYEKPQKGRLREHWQFNCDIFGAPEMEGEIEILQMAIHFLNHLGATDQHFEILINDREIVDAVFGRLMKVNKETAHKLYKIIDKSKKVAPAVLKKMIDDLKLGERCRKIFDQYLTLGNFNDLMNFLEKNQLNEKSASFEKFVNQIKRLELVNYIKYDPTIVRGLDYYTGIVFEIFDKHPENRRAISGGGSYANLLKIFNEPPLPGVGMGLGDVTLKDFLTVHKLLPDFSTPNTDLFLTFQDSEGKNPALILAQNLRKKDVRVVTGLESIKIKKVFPLAEKRGATFVGLIGANELNNNTVQLKNMKTREQTVVPLDDIKQLVGILK